MMDPQGIVKHLIRTANLQAMRVEPDGVPCIVQAILFDFSRFLFAVLYFDNSVVFLSGDSVPGLELWGWPDAKQEQYVIDMATDVFLLTRGAS